MAVLREAGNERPDSLKAICVHQMCNPAALLIRALEIIQSNPLVPNSYGFVSIQRNNAIVEDTQVNFLVPNDKSMGSHKYAAVNFEEYCDGNHVEDGCVESNKITGNEIQIIINPRVLMETDKTEVKVKVVERCGLDT
ncbi:hypothetical protein ANN_04140 [Periplaneta americana]|uniref:Uncharacterized protein n=1 Tax=Periplaneta americana TaxID=6978 RepID=A0ABQ8T8G9_PERAM|nr:hypothetical protein ANN_04140 [Periplaneta americana]